MKRREVMLSLGIALFGLMLLSQSGANAAEQKKHKVLYFTRSAGFEHSAIQRNGEELSVSEKILTELGKKHGIEVVCAKDGRVFDGDLGQYDAILFYTSGDLTQPDAKKTPPMTAAGKKKLLDAIAAGKGFIGFHSASDTFHSKGNANENQTEVDPFLAMLGGEFVTHGKQQTAKMLVVSRDFPGLRDQQLGDSFNLMEEWYALKNFAKDMHVILVQETEGMEGPCYQRPPFAATWAKMHGKGRVFYTSLGHRHEIWQDPQFQQSVLGALAWVMGDVEADITPNLDKVAPKSSQLGK
jgi:uncharacterized protein